MNPVTNSSTELTVHLDGSITGFVNAGLPGAAPVNYVWKGATGQIVDPTGAYTFDVERVGDHATNIAEDVIFIVEARDVRHHAGEIRAGEIQPD